MNGDLYFDRRGVESCTAIGNLYIKSGTTTFTGNAKASNATIVVDGGTLAAGSNNAWGDPSEYSYITINSGALQAVSGTTPTLGNNIMLNGDVTFSGSSDLTLRGTIDLGNAPRTLTVTNTGHTYLTGKINLNDDVTFTGSSDLTISAGIDLGSAARTLTVDNTCVTTILGDIVGGGIAKAGSGTLVLSGNNSFVFGPEIDAGTLVAASDLALGQFFASVTLNGGTLQAGGTGDRTLANPINVTAQSCINGVASNALTLTGNITMGNNGYDFPAVSVKGTGNVTLAGAISGNDEIDMTSTGTLTLSGDNRSGDTLTGLICLYSGTLVAANDSALGYSDLYLYGGTLQAGGAGARTLSNSIDVYADSCIHDLTLSGPIALWGNNNLTLSNVTVPASVGCTGGLILSSGTVTLSGDNTYTGGTKISAGTTLVVAGTSPLGTGNLQLIEGTTLQAGDAGDCTFNNAVTLTGNPCIGAAAGHALTLAGQVSGSGGFSMNGLGTLTLSGADNPYTGDTTVNSGTLASGANNAIGQGATSINTGATVNLGGYKQTFATLNGGGNLTGNGIMTISAGDFSGTISGSIGQVVKDTAGTLTLSGKNSYYGNTVLLAGTLVAANDSALGTSNLLQMAGGTLQAGGSGDRTLDNYVWFTADSSINGVASNPLTLTGADFGGGIVLNNYTLSVTGAGDVTLAGQIDGNIAGIGGITMNSTGTLTLFCGDNFYSNTTVNSGTLASGADNAIGQSGTTSIAEGAKVNLGGYNQTFATLTGAGELTGTGVMTMSAGDFSGVISGSGGQVVKDTAGTLTLSGQNTYTGGTTVSAGTLVAAHAAALGTGAVEVGANETDEATLRLTSDLWVGDFTLNQMAVLQVDAGKTLTLSVSFYNFSQTKANWPSPDGFNLTMSGSTFEVAGLDSGAVAAGFTSNFNLDTLTVTGHLELVDEVNNGNRGGIHGDQEALYVNFLTGASGATLDLSGLWLYVYNDGDYFALADGIYNNITVTGSPVPVPGAVWLLGSGLLGLLGLRRKYLG